MSTTDWPQPEGDWRQPTGGIPPGGGPPGARRGPPLVKLIIALALLASLSWVLILIAQYCETQRPLSQLPGVPAPVAGLFGPTAEYRGSLDGVQRPLGVALTGGHVFVTESAGERRVRVFDRSGKEIAPFAPPETNVPSRVPLYIAVSPKGDIYFSDRRGAAIYIFSADGQFQGTFQPQSVPAEDWHPMGLAFDKRGNL